MSIVRKVSGSLVSTGPVVHDGANNGAEPAALYDYIRVEDHAGEEVYLERVIIPGYLDSLIDVGTVGTLYIVEVPIPTMFFGSKPMYFVYAVETGGKVRKGIEQTQRCLRSAKAGAAKLFGYGFVLLIAYGLGVLLWIQAYRLLKINLPLAQMQREVS